MCHKYILEDSLIQIETLWLRLSGEIIQIFAGKLEMTHNDDLCKQLTFNKRYYMKVIHETLEIDYLSEASQQPGELQALLLSEYIGTWG